MLRNKAKMAGKAAVAAAVLGLGVSAANAGFTYDLRIVGADSGSNGKTLTGPAANTDYTLQLWGRITGDTTFTNDDWLSGYTGVDSGVGGSGAAFSGTGVGITSAVAGTHVAVVNVLGGTSNTTLDSIQDWGGTTTGSTTNWMFWRGGAAPGYPGGTFDAESVQVGANAQEVLLGSFTVHVGATVSTTAGAATSFAVRNAPRIKSGVSTINTIAFTQDGTAITDFTNSVTIGAPVQFVIPAATNGATSQVALGAAQFGGSNAATGGNIQIVKNAPGQYVSEVDDLTGNTNKGFAPIGPTAINGAEGPVYAMLWLQDTDTGNSSTIASLLSDLGAAGGSVYSVLDANTDPMAIKLKNFAAYAGFNGLIKFNTPLTDTSNFSWDFANNTDIVVDKLAVVPEPATIGLLGLAGLGLAARRRRKA